jgi:hypothetical protein
MCSNKCYKAARDKGTVDKIPAGSAAICRSDTTAVSCSLVQRSLSKVEVGERPKARQELSETSQCHERHGRGTCELLLSVVDVA